MRKKTQRIKYLCTDYLSASLAWLVFNIIRFYDVAQYEGYSSLAGFLLSGKLVAGQIIIPLFWLILHYYSGYYNKPLEKSRLSEFFTTFQTAFIGTLMIFFSAILNELPQSFHIFYTLFLVLLAITFVFTYIPRLIITQRSSRKIQNKEWTINALILGNGKTAAYTKSLLETLTDSYGYDIKGFIDTGSICFNDKDLSCKVLGGIGDLGTIIKTHEIEALIVAVDTEDNKELLSLLYSLYQYKLPIKLPISQAKLLTGGVKLDSLAGVPLIDVTDNNFPEGEKNIKLTLDKLISGFLLLLLLPLYIYLVIRVKLDSVGPVFFRQERIGYSGKPFMIYKFRTMAENAEEDGPSLSSLSDLRITKFGRLMRKYRLDELPQFWNVLKGDMSLVGPRPERRHYIDLIVKKAPYFYLLHNVRPGITSWGMVKYGYASTVEQMIERTQYDILYYENMSLMLDLKILIYTVRTIVTGKGV